MITAVDVGATKVLIAQFGTDGKPVNVSRFLTPPKPHDFLRQLYEHLDNFEQTDCIVIGVPGMVDENGVLLRCGNLSWKNLAVQQILEERYHVPVRVENDAQLAGLSEITRLSPAPQLGLYLTVSTGIGVGVVVDGRIHPAFRNSEPGHMLLHFNGQWQPWEKFASGRSLVKHFGKEAHDFTRESEWREVADRLSRGLFALIPTMQPEVIVFGGSVGSFFEHVDDLLEEKLKALGPYITTPELRKAHQPNEAVLHGCYHYAITQLAS